MTLTRIHVLWEKAGTSENIWIDIVLSSTLCISMKEKSYRSLINCIFILTKMVNITLFVLIRQYILGMKRWHLCQLSRIDNRGRWLEISQLF